MGQRVARDENGNTYYVPENTTFEEWKKGLVAGGKSFTKGAESGIIQIGKSVGAKADTDRVLLPNGVKGKIQEGSRITKVVAIAGKGTAKPVKVARYLEEQYGVKAAEWKKCRGDGYVVCPDESVKHAELHWFESTKTGRIKMKVKRWFDES